MTHVRIALPITRSDVLRLGGETLHDLRIIERTYRGETRVRSTTRARIAAAAKRLGIAPPPEPREKVPTSVVNG